MRQENGSLTGRFKGMMVITGVILRATGAKFPIHLFAAQWEV